MARLTLPKEDALTPEQRVVRDEVVAGPRGKMPSPMRAWIRNPSLARAAQKLGEELRFATSLDERTVEIAILVCARHWTSHQVWTSHARYARGFGVGDEVIASIAAGKLPILERQREQIAVAVCHRLLADGRIADDLYERALDAFGETGVVELVALVGYYGLVALTANAFELGLPESVAAELDDPDLRTAS